MTVARIEAAVRVGNANHRPRQFVVRIAHGFCEGATHVNGKVTISVGLQSAQKAAFGVVLVTHGSSTCFSVAQFCLTFLKASGG
jgi:hypothetical protein